MAEKTKTPAKRKGGAPLKFTPAKQKKFLEFYGDTCRKVHAATFSRVSYATFRRWLEKNPEFEKLMEEAEEHYHAKLLEHHQNLLFVGEKKEYFNKDGDLTAVEHRIPIKLVEMELKRRDPAYKEKTGDSTTIHGGVMVAPGAIVVEQWINEVQVADENKEKPSAKRDK